MAFGFGNRGTDNEALGMFGVKFQIFTSQTSLSTRLESKDSHPARQAWGVWGGFRVAKPTGARRGGWVDFVPAIIFDRNSRV
jgi:hypothetical protein